MRLPVFRRITSLILVLVLAVSAALPAFAEETEESDPFTPDFTLNSKAVVLTNMDDGTVVFSQNADELMYPASLTKIMTCILAVESGVDFSTIVTAPSYIFDDLYGLNASTADIRQGEEVEFGDLIYAMMLPSACEAASIIADYLSGGDISAFVQQMNDKAAELGATNTHFTNPHGLHDDEQVTTAADMTTILLYALQNETFTTIVTTQSYTMKATNKHSSERTYQHTNYMLSKGLGGTKYYYQYAQGIKTGTTDESGRNLTSMASKDGYNYLLVTLGAPIYDEEGEQLDNGAFLDAIHLYEWAFNNLSYRTVYGSGDILDTIKVKYAWDVDSVNLTPSSGVTLLLPNTLTTDDITVDTDLPDSVNATVEQGQEIGTATLSYNGRELAQITLVSTMEVRRSWAVLIWDHFVAFVTAPLFIIIFLIVVILAICYITYAVQMNKKRRRRKAIDARYRKK